MIRRTGHIVALLALGLGAPGLAGEHAGPHLGQMGAPGILDMPVGDAQGDADLSFGLTSFAGQTRGTLGFQILPRLGGTFRYTRAEDLPLGRFTTYYDRSFDLRFQLLEEGDITPAVTLGLIDFLGTGLYASEYIAATKRLGPDLRVTAGLGWGRMGSSGTIGSTGTRPPLVIGTGGKPNWDQWFRGDFAPFGGVEWQATDRLRLKAELSSDAYDLEVGTHNVFERRTPLNFGADYKVGKNGTLGLSYMYGSQLGLSYAYVINPARAPSVGSTGPGGTPVAARPSRATDPEAWETDWIHQADGPAILRANLRAFLEPQGITLDALTLYPDRVHIRIRNRIHEVEAQAIGRVARVLSVVMPASVETFQITPVVRGLAMSTVTLARADIEALEHRADGAEALLARAGISAGPLAPAPQAERNEELAYPDFGWSLAPYAATALFDPDNPLRVDVGLRLKGQVDLTPGLSLKGSVIKRLAGNLDSSDRVSNSVLPHVRSDANVYDREGDPALEYLTADVRFRPGENLYARVTGGYLERMYGGAAAEILWKPVDSRLALGAEIAYARQRDFDLQLGFQDYDIVTGHASAYYSLANGFQAQVDAGRYLAGDWGATFSLDREFANGWSVGAYFTLTDVPFSEFGEGSFDKGLKLSIPLAWSTGKPSRRKAEVNLRPVLRDGGARLWLADRLYEDVRGYHRPDLARGWGRVWR